MQILTVDDNDIALEMLRHALTQAGHEVVAAHDGHTALKILPSGVCYLVISD